MYEDKFRKGLLRYIGDNCLKQSAIAKKANIRKDTFSRILNGKRRIFGEEIAGICLALGKSFDEIMNYAEHEESDSKAG